MLGQPVSMLIPRVVGFKLTGELPEGATATDLVLTITEMLRKHGVVGKFVEFYGDGRRRRAAGQPRHDRQHEPGVRLDRARSSRSTTRPLDYLRLTGRSDEQVALVEAYAKEQGLWHDPAARAGLLRVPRARPVDRRPVDRRPEAPAGPDRADRRQGSLPRRRWRDYVDDAESTTTAYDEAVERVLPGLRPAGVHGADGDERAARAVGRRAASRRRPRRASRSTVDLGRRHAVRARPRRRRDRRDHLVHQHLQPVGDDRRRRCWPRTPSSRA